LLATVALQAKYQIAENGYLNKKLKAKTVYIGG